eukprot:524446_1
MSGNKNVGVDTNYNKPCDIPVINIQHAHDYSLALSSISGIYMIVEYWWKQYRNITQLSTDIITVIITYFVRKNNYSISYIFSIGGDSFGGNGHGRRYKSYWEQPNAFRGLDIIKIRTGYEHSLFLESNGCVWCCGNNDYGQLGLGHFHETKSLAPTVIHYFVIQKIKIKEIECGNFHTLSIDYNQKIYSWGRNNMGQCGHVKKGYINKPKLIASLEGYKIRNIDCGDAHSYCMTFDGEHYLWGINEFNECLVFDGQLIVNIPYCINKVIKQRAGGKNIKAVSLNGCLTNITVR